MFSFAIRNVPAELGNICFPKDFSIRTHAKFVILLSEANVLEKEVRYIFYDGSVHFNTHSRVNSLIHHLCS